MYGGTVGLFAITFEVAQEGDPATRVSATHARSRILLRPAALSGGPPGTNLATVFGPPAAAEEFSRAVRNTGPDVSIETLSARPGAMTFAVSGEPGGDLHARLLDAFKGDVFVEPALASGGKLLGRLLVPPSCSQASARAAIQEAVAGSPARLIGLAPIGDAGPPARPALLDVADEALLRIAFAFGHYTSPKGATLETVAQLVGLTTSPLHKRLAAAERTVVEAALDPSSARAEPRPRTGLGNGTTFEARVRITGVTNPLSRLIAQEPELSAYVQPLGSGLQAALLGPAEARARFLERLRLERPFELVAAQPAHDMIRLDPERADSVAGVASRFGPDAFARPSRMSGGAIELRLVLFEAIAGRHLDLMLTASAMETGCDGAEILDWRAGTLDLPAIPTTRVVPLTARQEQVLRVAHALGYYRSPRGATLAKVATTLGISTNAAHKSLTTAEEKLIATYLAARA